MSLVNDMLRDLDNRRKESSGTPSSVKLTPAPEVVGEGSRRPHLIYLVIALAVGAGAVLWFWMQQDGSSSTRQLDIAPLVVNQPEIQIPEDNTVDAEELSMVEESPELNSDSDDTVESTESNSDQTNLEGIASSTVTIEEQSESTVQAPANLDLTVAQNQSRVSDSTENPDLLESDQETRDEGIELVELTEVPAQEVKNSAELTPEEKDLVAVQESLRLIADNKKAEAYSELETEIAENRYAHQSRETYAKLLMSEGNLLGAFELNEAGLALSPNHSGFKKIKARLLIADGQLNEAVSLLLSRAPAVNEDLEYHDILATAQLASRDFEGALISYTELIQSDQSQGKWWYGFAASQDSLGNSNAAKQGYSQAVSQTNLSASLRRRSQERLAILSR